MELTVDAGRFTAFHEKIALPMRLPPTVRKLLAELSGLDVDSTRVADVVQSNPFVEQRLLRLIEKLELKQGTPSLAAAIPLLGMRATRDFVVGLQLVRVTAGRALPNDAELKPADYLRYALRAEEFVQERNFSYADSAYAAGLMFDVLVLLGREKFKAGKSFEELVEQVFVHGLKTARIGVELAKAAKNFGFARHLFGACLVHDIGKVALELEQPAAHAAFRAHCEKEKLSRCARHLLETKKLGFPHDHAGAFLIRHFGVLREVEPAVLYHHDPYLIRKSRPKMYPLAALIALASNMANQFQVPKDLGDPILKTWLTPELKGYEVAPPLLLATMNRVIVEKF